MREGSEVGRDGVQRSVEGGEEAVKGRCQRRVGGGGWLRRQLRSRAGEEVMSWPAHTDSEMLGKASSWSGP